MEVAAGVAPWLKAIVVWGVFLWMAVNLLNHLQDAGGLRHGIAMFMRMESLDQPPPIPTPLKARRIDSAAAHTLVLIFIVVAQGLTALLFGLSALWFALGDAVAATRIGRYAFGTFTATWFVFLIGDAWFAAWLRLDALQRTHLLLLLIGLAGLLLMAR
jgi:Predicted small integral membrane protein (DUF2165)